MHAQELENSPELTTDRLLLRPVALSDAPLVQLLAGDRDVAATTESLPHPYENGMAEKWILSTLEKAGSGELAHFAITLRSNGSFIGSIELRLNRNGKEAELGYWVGKPYWNLGYATEAAAAVLRYGLEDLELDRVRAWHISRNSASGRVLEKIGMRYQGRLEGVLEKWGVWEDLDEYELSRKEFTANED